MAYAAPSITASGTTFAQFQAGGVSGHLEKLIAAQGATLAPTVAHTWTATGGGSTLGLLAAGTYYSVVTETNGWGETTIGPESGQITVSAGNKPRITFAALKSGNTARNVYIGAVNGTTGGPYKLYATGITASTYDLLVAAPTNSYAVSAPLSNSTGVTYVDSRGVTHNDFLSFIRQLERDTGFRAYKWLRDNITNFNQGNPVTFLSTIEKLHKVHAVFAVMSTLCSEMGTLIDSNPGTITNTTTTIGTSSMARTQP